MYVVIFNDTGLIYGPFATRDSAIGWMAESLQRFSQATITIQPLINPIVEEEKD